MRRFFHAGHIIVGEQKVVDRGNGGRGMLETVQRLLETAAAEKRGLWKTVLRQAVCAALGFLFSGVEFAGGLAPFGLSFAGGADTGCTLAASLGAAAGYLVFRDVSGALRGVSAVALLCFVKIGTGRMFTPGRRIYLFTVATFAAGFLCSLIVSAAQPLRAAAVLVDLCGAVIAAAGACFFYRGFHIASLGRGAKCVSTADFVALLFAETVLLMSLTRLPAAGVSLAHIAAGFTVMLLALCGLAQAPSMAGVCFGLALGLTLGDRRPFFPAAFSLAGLVCGVCGDYGKYAVAAGFAAAELLALTLRGSADTAAVSVIETALAAAAFLAVPKKALLAALSEVLPPRGDRGAQEQRSLMTFRLRSAARAVKEVGATVKAVSDLLVKTETPDPAYIPGTVKTEVCDGCAKREVCWERSGTYTEESLREAFALLRKNGGLAEEDLPRRFQLVCREKKAVCGAFNRLWYEYNARLTARQELLETKELAAVQFSGASAVLEDAARSLSGVERADPHTASAAREVLEEFGFTADPVLAYSDGRGRSTVEALCSVVPRAPDFTALTERLYEKTGLSFLDPLADPFAERGTLLRFAEAAELSAEAHAAVRVGAGETVCGDTCRCFHDGRGNYYVVLSDGMGRGKRAALDSALVCTLTSRLVRAGFSLDCAVRAVNTALMTRSAEETLATLDILRIDLSDGQTWFFKAGAAASVVRTMERTAMVERSSLPLGILKEAELAQAETRLCAGDRVLLMSDGAGVLPPQYFKELFGRMKKKSVRELAETAADEAMKYSPTGRHDDITVVAVEVK